MEIDGTKKQSDSEKWRSEWWFRLTASTCLEAYKVGKSVLENSNNAASSSKKFSPAFLETLREITFCICLFVPLR